MVIRPYWTKRFRCFQSLYHIALSKFPSKVYCLEKHYFGCLYFFSLYQAKCILILKHMFQCTHHLTSQTRKKIPSINQRKRLKKMITGILKVGIQISNLTWFLHKKARATCVDNCCILFIYWNSPSYDCLLTLRLLFSFDVRWGCISKQIDI